MSVINNDIKIPMFFIYSIICNQINENLYLDFNHFLKKEKNRMKLSKISDSEFQLSSPKKSIIIKFLINTISHKIFYDIYLTKYNVHLKEQTLYNFERLCSIIKKQGNQHIPYSIPDIVSIIDYFLLWAQKNNYHIKWKELS